MSNMDNIRAKADEVRKQKEEAAKQGQIPLMDIEVGDEMVFRVDDVSPSPFPKKKEGDLLYTITVLDDPEKPQAKLRTQTALMSNLKKAEITEKGDYGYLKREQDRQSKDGNRYYDYTVVKLSEDDVKECLDTAQSAAPAKKGRGKAQ